MSQHLSHPFVGLLRHGQHNLSNIGLTIQRPGQTSQHNFDHGGFVTVRNGSPSERRRNFSRTSVDAFAVLAMTADAERLIDRRTFGELDFFDTVKSRQAVFAIRRINVLGNFCVFRLGN